MPIDAADPIDYPLIKLKAQTKPEPLEEESHALKFRVGDVIRLYREHKLDLFNLEVLTGPPAYEQLCKIIAAGILHSCPSATWEEIANRLDFEELGIIDQTVADAIKKASARARRKSTMPEPPTA